MKEDLEKRVGAVDSGDQYAATMALPDHLRDALWRVSSAKLDQLDASGLIVCGMGGSAIGGDLAAAALGGRLERPLDVVRGYGVPSWTLARPRDPLLELLGQHRGDDGLLRRRGGGRRASGSSRRPAARSPRRPGATAFR